MNVTGGWLQQQGQYDKMTICPDKTADIMLCAEDGWLTMGELPGWESRGEGRKTSRGGKAQE